MDELRNSRKTFILIGIVIVIVWAVLIPLLLI